IDADPQVAPPEDVGHLRTGRHLPGCRQRTRRPQALPRMAILPVPAGRRLYRGRHDDALRLRSGERPGTGVGLRRPATAGEQADQGRADQGEADQHPGTTSGHRYSAIRCCTPATSPASMSRVSTTRPGVANLNAPAAARAWSSNSWFAAAMPAARSLSNWAKASAALSGPVPTAAFTAAG